MGVTCRNWRKDHIYVYICCIGQEDGKNRQSDLSSIEKYLSFISGEGFKSNYLEFFPSHLFFFLSPSLPSFNHSSTYLSLL